MASELDQAVRKFRQARKEGRTFLARMNRLDPRAADNRLFDLGGRRLRQIRREAAIEAHYEMEAVR